jgi:MFS family permease
MLAWFGELNVTERRTMGACFGGWALDAFDVQMYSFVIPTVIALWGVSRGQAGLIGTVTLLISSLGGWFSGTLADRFGRVRMLQITILWYSIFTFLCAFAQNFERLFVCARCTGSALAGNGRPGRC